MKNKLNLIITVLFSMALFSSCKITYPVTQHSGKEDIAYLLFVSEGNKSYDVEVIIDEGKAFSAETVKAKKADRKGDIYTVNTGKRKITVIRDGGKVYEKYIFLSPQETKKISLP